MGMGTALVFISAHSQQCTFLTLPAQQSLDFRESHEAEPQPLWEYPCRALTQPRAVMTFDFLQCVPEQPIRCQGSLPFTRYGLLFWSQIFFFLIPVSKLSLCPSQSTFSNMLITAFQMVLNTICVSVQEGTLPWCGPVDGVPTE